MTCFADDELAILRLLARLAQAGDDRDEVAYRQCLSAGVQGADPHAPPVPAADYASAAIERISQMEWTHHQLCNPVVTFTSDGDRASVSIDGIADMAFLDDRRIRRRQTIGGRYTVGLVRTDAGWLIDRRTFQRRYVDCGVRN